MTVSSGDKVSKVMLPDRLYNNTYDGKLLLISVSMAASAAYIPGASLSDKLRLAASKGQVEKVHELINSGATFEPDRVSVIKILCI